MEDKELYRQILGVVQPWQIIKIDLNMSKQEVHIFLEYPLPSTGNCPKCGKSCTIHDKREDRIWRHLDTCQLRTFIHCQIPRVICSEHKTITMDVPWSSNMSRFTNHFERFAIDLIKATKNRQKAADLLRISWDEIDGIMKRAVKRGLNRRSDDAVPYLGIDEKSFLKGHKYATVLTDITGKRVLDVAENRDSKAVDMVWKSLSDKQKQSVQAVSMDFWQAYKTGAEIHVPNAAIVHDKFHIMKYMNDAVDMVRKQEHKIYMKNKDDTLKGKKYLFLKNRENFTKEQRSDFRELNLDQLAVGRAWNRKELLRNLWNYTYEKPARNFFQKWYYSATHSRLEPVIKVAKLFKKHFENIVSFLKHRITNAFAEGINSVIQHIKASARGFRNFENYRTAILFFCGGLNLYPQETR
ncbi:MAG: ISL3 family transposase [bacterium]